MIIEVLHEFNPSGLSASYFVVLFELLEIFVIRADLNRVLRS